MIVTTASFKGGVGKTTTALHLAAYFQTQTPTLLVDGDLNRSAWEWSQRGQLPFKVCDEKQAVKYARHYDRIVIDTPARPEPQDLKTIAEGCDLLVLPCTPDAMALSAMLHMVESLQALETEYRILLTIVPPKPSTAGDDARQTIEEAGLPIFNTQIRRLAAFQKASLEGVSVNQVKDRMANIAWNCYVEVGREILA
ncbi:MAG: ParA family protein [Pleurocapsa sp. MO_226.B13]|nr:ParA family protein [Pleurocapsa sp. MO_226.B13]